MKTFNMIILEAKSEALIIAAQGLFTLIWGVVI